MWTLPFFVRIRRPFALVVTAVLTGVVFALVFFVVPGLGAPGAPVPLLPASGSTIIIPTFSWMSAPGAVKYEIQISPLADFSVLIFTDQTKLFNLTPVNSFGQGVFYWRVRAYDDENNPGAWSSGVLFNKYIPAPVLQHPPNNLAVAEPLLQWKPVQGAVEYKIELSTDPVFTTVNESYKTYGTSLMPLNSIPDNLYYWRVCGLDSNDHCGDWSQVGNFLKRVPGPQLLSPVSGFNPANGEVTTPRFSWTLVPGAATYCLELARNAQFDPVAYSENTNLTEIALTNAIPPGGYYWRVRGVQANNQPGSWSAVGQFTLLLRAPRLVAPLNQASVIIPFLVWSAPPEAVAFRVEISTDLAFLVGVRTYTTNNTQLTPVDALPPGVPIYWRVTSLDSQNHVGGVSAAGVFTLVVNQILGGSTVITLQTPLNGEIITGDPTFRWTPVVGAADYHIRVSKNPDMSGTAYDYAYPDYPTFTPYASKRSYENGVYYWQVEARSSTGSIIDTSPIYSFTRQAVLLLSNPEYGVVLPADPVFTWKPVPGAVDYHIRISQNPDMSDTAYDYAYPDYPVFVPFSSKRAYENGLYYWQVEARTGSGLVIAKSEIRSFTRQQVLPLSAPRPGEILFGVDPVFQWERVVGAVDYHIIISEMPDLSGTDYDYAYPDYTAYAPYTYKKSYAHSPFYWWQVEARTGSGSVIARSAIQVFQKQSTVLLNAPANGAVLGSTPTFFWTPVLGAHDYYIKVSTSPTMVGSYDYAYPDYPIFTPYTNKQTYANDVYYWQVIARTSSGAEVARSDIYVFTVDNTQPTSTPLGAPTFTPSLTPSITPSPTLKPGEVPTPTGAPPNPPAEPRPANTMEVGEVVVYADAFTSQGGSAWLASGNVRLGPGGAVSGAARLEGAYAQVVDGYLLLDTQAGSIQGSSASKVSLLMDDGTASPVFQGEFTVNSQTGAVNTLLNAVFQLTRVGDLGVDTSEPLADFIMNVLEGTVTAHARVTAYEIEGAFPEMGLEFTLHHDGSVSGSVGLGEMEFEAAGVTFSVSDAAFSYSPSGGGQILIGEASITLPPAFDLGTKGSVTDIILSKDGLEDIGGGTIELSLPDMNVPGTGGKFNLAGASIALTLSGGGQYLLKGRADFSLPNIASTKTPGTSYDGSLYAEFELDQDGLRYVLLGGEVEPGIPIGQSGLALTGMEGRVTLRPEVRVQITGTIESQLEVPPLGPVVSGEPSIWVQLSKPYEIGISGEVKVLIFDAAEASLVLSQSQGLYGSLHINYLPYLMTGDASLHVWRSDGKFHFTGSATVTLGFEKGALGEYWGVSLPPVGATFAQISAKVGEFCSNSACTSTTYGFKGAVDITIRVNYFFGSKNITLAQFAFFLNANGSLSFGSTLDTYRLVDQARDWAALAASGESVGSTDVLSFTVEPTDFLMVGLDWQQGSPTFSLRDPDGFVVDMASSYPGAGYTQTITSTVFFVENPKAGAWQGVVENLEGGEDYTFGALGRNLPPSLAAGRAVSARVVFGRAEDTPRITGSQVFTITWSAFDADPDTTLALYYDTDVYGFDGSLIAAGLDPAAGSYTWTGEGVPESGQYYVYAVVDDLKNLPVSAYFDEVITLQDQIAPAIPSGLSVEVNEPKSSLLVCWDNPIADAAAGFAPADPSLAGYYVYFGSAPGIFDLGFFDAFSLGCYGLPVPPRLPRVYVSVAAYDFSGNLSDLSEVQMVELAPPIQIYLPLLLR